MPRPCFVTPRRQPSRLFPTLAIAAFLALVAGSAKAQPFEAWLQKDQKRFNEEQKKELGSPKKK